MGFASDFLTNTRNTYHNDMEIKTPVTAIVSGIVGFGKTIESLTKDKTVGVKKDKLLTHSKTEITPKKEPTIDNNKELELLKQRLDAQQQRVNKISNDVSDINQDLYGDGGD